MTMQPTPAESDHVPTGTAFSLLTDRRRRQIVTHLADRQSPVTLDALACVVVRAEAADHDSGAPTAALKRVKSELHHVHLPKLAAADVVAYDYEEQTVTPVAVDQLSPYLSAAPSSA